MTPTELVKQFNRSLMMRNTTIGIREVEICKLETEKKLLEKDRDEKRFINHLYPLGKINGRLNAINRQLARMKKNLIYPDKML